MNYSNANIDIDKNMKLALGIGFHIIFWIVMIIYYFYSMDLFNIPFEFALRSKLYYFPFQLIAAYFMVFVLLGRYLYKGRYLIAIIGFLFFIFFFSYVSSILSLWVVNPYFNPEFVRPEFSDILLDIEGLISGSMRIIFITPMILVCLEFAASQYQKMKDVDNLILLKEKTELDFLKTQIHPDFLLSTLRNLESLTKENNEDGPVVIEKLSEILDYILYKGRQDKIEIQNELDALNEYIALENIRFKDALTIDLSYGNIDAEKHISPLILFSFLELNFKGYDKTNVPFAACEIQFHMKDNILECKIRNHTFLDKKSNLVNYDLDKMKRQLDISYPKKYTIKVEDESDDYRIHLTLEL